MAVPVAAEIINTTDPRLPLILRNFTALSYDETAIRGSVEGDPLLTEETCKVELGHFVKTIVSKSRVMLTDSNPLVLTDHPAKFFVIESTFSEEDPAVLHNRMLNTIKKRRDILAKILHQYPRALRVAKFVLQERT